MRVIALTMLGLLQGCQAGGLIAASALTAATPEQAAQSSCMAQFGVTEELHSKPYRERRAWMNQCIQDRLAYYRENPGAINEPCDANSQKKMSEMSFAERHDLIRECQRIGKPPAR